MAIIAKTGHSDNYSYGLKLMLLLDEWTTHPNMNLSHMLGAVSHLVQSGKVLFPEHGAEELILQLTGFGVEKHDDLVDAFSILLSMIIEEDNKPRAVAMNFRGKYGGEFDHLPPDERERKMKVRERLRSSFLL
ncbi:MAG: hypothetical protein A3B08_01750 [Candidatus Taylorbacteria bacterium RIFCSPLOWO2_01_FULL_43_44]|nr:MAG: hypothetical protein A3B08_01750 [Candidatus Taylorbacteria bacterium RIFCSPLOWO2_01_FULL_43_44]